MPAELPEGQCSAVTRLKYVLWELVCDASAYWIAVQYFTDKNDQTDIFSEIKVFSNIPDEQCRKSTDYIYKSIH